MNERLKNIKTEYDLIIIGGGIYGTTLLWEAAQRGLSAILLDKNDFCGATSANSLKIIHGGLRYLQSFDLKRIRESAKELNNLLNIAPNLVHPLPCVIPTYPQIKNNRLSMGLAFKAYDFLCFGSRTNNKKLLPSGKILSKNEVHQLIPMLNLGNYTGGAMWHDALNFNSERLGLAFIQSAREQGADAFNYMKFQKLVLRKNRVIGVQAYDKITRQKLEILGKMVVNTTGPWINEVSRQLSRDKKDVQFAKAVNLIVSRSLSNLAFGLKDTNPSVDDCNQSNRFLFFVPWREATMIGTWYFSHSSSPDAVNLTENEFVKCMGQVQRLVPDAQIQKDEVCFVHSGLVPIDSSYRHRKFKLKDHYSIIDYDRYGGPEGFISVLGVKYTTSRNIAAKTIELVFNKLNRKLRSRHQENHLQVGGPIKNIDKFLQGKSENNQHNLNEKTVRNLALNYGSHYMDIEKLISHNAELGSLIPGSDEAIKAELPYCLKNEFVVHLSDLILRRTGIGSLKKPKNDTVEFCADFMAKEAGWSESRKQDEINILHNFYNSLIIK